MSLALPSDRRNKQRPSPRAESLPSLLSPPPLSSSTPVTPDNHPPSSTNFHEAQMLPPFLRSSTLPQYPARPPALSFDDFGNSDSWHDPMEELLQSSTSTMSRPLSTTARLTRSNTGSGITSGPASLLTPATSNPRTRTFSADNVSCPDGGTILGALPGGIGNNNNNNEIINSRLHDEARITNWSSVLRLCATSPQLARFSGPDRWTALHHACNRRPPADVVEALLRAHPDALTEQDQKGWTPLHHACRFKASVEVVRLLLTLYPSRGKIAASRRGTRGRTPLYYAIRYEAPEGVMELLLEAESTAVLEEDRAGESPLTLVWDTYALSNAGKRDIKEFLEDKEHKPMGGKLKRHWEKVTLLLKSAYEGEWKILHAIAGTKCHPTLFTIAKYLHPEQLKEVDNETGRTALHRAAMSHSGGEASLSLIRTIISVFPEACEMVDKQGALPLHHAVELKKNWIIDGVMDIYNCHPRAVEKLDQRGRTPLHLAAKAINQWVDTPVDPQRSIILNLLTHYPTAATLPDHNGHLPLHYVALHAEIKDYNAEAILKAHPAALRHRIAIPTSDVFGALPLHLAATSPDSKPSLIQWLLDSNSRSVMQADGKGRLPLHLACDAGKNWDQGVDILYKAYPKGLTELDRRKWTPLHYAAASPNTSEDLVDNLIKHDALVSQPDNRGRHPLHLACRSGMGWDTGIKHLFDAFPGAIYSPDCCNMLPLHHAIMRGCSAGQVPNEKDNFSVDDLADIQTVFQILVIDPTILDHV